MQTCELTLLLFYQMRGVEGERLGLIEMGPSEGLNSKRVETLISEPCRSTDIHHNEADFTCSHESGNQNLRRSEFRKIYMSKHTIQKISIAVVFKLLHGIITAKPPQYVLLLDYPRRPFI